MSILGYTILLIIAGALIAALVRLTKSIGLGVLMVSLVTLVFVVSSVR